MPGELQRDRLTGALFRDRATGAIRRNNASSSICCCGSCYCSPDKSGTFPNKILATFHDVDVPTECLWMRYNVGGCFYNASFRYVSAPINDVGICLEYQGPNKGCLWRGSIPAEMDIWQSQTQICQCADYYYTPPSCPLLVLDRLWISLRLAWWEGIGAVASINATFGDSSGPEMRINPCLPGFFSSELNTLQYFNPVRTIFASGVDFSGGVPSSPILPCNGSTTSTFNYATWYYWTFYAPEFGIGFEDLVDPPHGNGFNGSVTLVSPGGC